MTDFRTPFKDDKDASSWARRYWDATVVGRGRLVEDRIEHEIGPEAKQKGYLTKEQFLVLGEWKSSRARKHYANNSEESVKETTRAAFAAADEQGRVGTLMELNGVHWPMASVILHFAHPDPYPILDIRATETLGAGRRASYNLEFWKEYTDFCRKVAVDLGLSMRDFDRALWAFSKFRGKQATKLERPLRTSWTNRG